MAIIKKSSIDYLGLAGDSKPTSGVVTNSTFLETDTFLEYVYNGSTWNLKTTAAVTESLLGKTIVDPIYNNFVDMNRVTVPANPGADMGRMYVKTVDSNNDGLFVKIKKAGAYVEVQIA